MLGCKRVYRRAVLSGVDKVGQIQIVVVGKLHLAAQGGDIDIVQLEARAVGAVDEHVDLALKGQVELGGVPVGPDHLIYAKSLVAVIAACGFNRDRLDVFAHHIGEDNGCLAQAAVTVNRLLNRSATAHRGCERHAASCAGELYAHKLFGHGARSPLQRWWHNRSR